MFDRREVPHAAENCLAAVVLASNLTRYFCLDRSSTGSPPRIVAMLSSSSVIGLRIAALFRTYKFGVMYFYLLRRLSLTSSALQSKILSFRSVRPSVVFVPWRSVQVPFP